MYASEQHRQEILFYLKQFVFKDFFWCGLFFFLLVFFDLVTVFFLFLMFWFFDPKAYGILAPLPRVEFETVLTLEGEVLTTRLPGKSLDMRF